MPVKGVNKLTMSIYSLNEFNTCINFQMEFSPALLDHACKILVVGSNYKNLLSYVNKIIDKRINGRDLTLTNDIDIEDIIQNHIRNIIDYRKMANALHLNWDDLPQNRLILDIPTGHTLFKKAIIKACYMNSKHWRMYFIQGFDYAPVLPPAHRSQIGMVFISNLKLQNDLESIWRDYARRAMSLKDFTELQEKYPCLVIDMQEQIPVIYIVPI